MQGLAEQLAGSQEQQNDIQDVILQIVQLLQQGMTPEQLIQNGVPEELVEVALDYINKQDMMSKTSGQEQQGLAAMVGQ